MTTNIDKMFAYLKTLDDGKRYNNQVVADRAGFEASEGSHHNPGTEVIVILSKRFPQWIERSKAASWFTIHQHYTPPSSTKPATPKFESLLPESDSPVDLEEIVSNLKYKVHLQEQRIEKLEARLS